MGPYDTSIFNHRSRSSGGLVKIIVAVLLIILGIGVAANTSWGKRAWKTTQSSWGDGIYREVIVYDAVGNQLYYDVGKFDIDYASERIMYDDENGVRHAIYFKDGTVIVNELDQDKE